VHRAFQSQRPLLQSHQLLERVQQMVQVEVEISQQFIECYQCLRARKTKQWQAKSNWNGKADNLRREGTVCEGERRQHDWQSKMEEDWCIQVYQQLAKAVFLARATWTTTSRRLDRGSKQHAEFVWRPGPNQDTRNEASRQQNSGDRLGRAR